MNFFLRTERFDALLHEEIDLVLAHVYARHRDLAAKGIAHLQERSLSDRVGCGGSLSCGLVTSASSAAVVMLAS